MSEETPTSPRIVLVDGDTSTTLDPAALVVALFATVPDALKGQVLEIAKSFTAQLAKGQTIQLQANRVVRPGLVTP